jgi:hypothetical protein
MDMIAWNRIGAEQTSLPPRQGKGTLSLLMMH